METEPPKKPEAVIVAEHALFKGMAPQYLAPLAETAIVKEFSAGELIFREGDPANLFGKLTPRASSPVKVSKDRGCRHQDG